MATDDFAALRDISNLLLTDENEQEARNRFIRFLDQYSGAGALGPIVDSLAARLGLFPYMSPNLDEISDAEALTVAYHSPRSLSDQGFTFHAEQQKIYERLMDGESVILSAPTSFGKSAIVDALVLSGKWENFVIIVPTIHSSMRRDADWSRSTRGTPSSRIPVSSPRSRTSMYSLRNASWS